MSLHLVGYIEEPSVTSAATDFEVVYVESVDKDHYNVWRKNATTAKLQQSVLNVTWLDVLKDWVSPQPAKHEYIKLSPGSNTFTCRIVGNWLVLETADFVYTFKIANYEFYVEDLPDNDERQILVRHKDSNTNFKGKLKRNALLGDVPHSKIPTQIINQFK